MKGLDMKDFGTGIPGGLDSVGSDAARIFLPDQRLTPAEAKLEQKKLKFEYIKRKVAITNWEKEQLKVGDKSLPRDEDLIVLKDRAKQRLSHAKNKTEKYRTLVNKLYKDYVE